MKSWGNPRAWVIVALIAWSGCASHSAPAATTPGAPRAEAGPPAAERPSLDVRVQSYWGFRQAKDLTGAYAFYCSAYKARVPLQQFLGMTRLIRFDLRDIRISGIDTQGTRAAVTLLYRFPAPMLDGQIVDGQATETWTHDVDGQWCKEDEPLGLPSAPPSAGVAPTPGR